MMKQATNAARRQLMLSCGEASCNLLPEIGGSVGSWHVQGQPLLRPTNRNALQRLGAFATGSFPLVPYSNRIGGGQFRWDEQAVRLARNFAPEPHSIHGVGFERPWSVESAGACSAILALHYPGGAAWPYPFLARQRFVLAEHALVIELTAVNLAAIAVPLSFGHHPYFPRAGARLQFAAQHVWMSGEDALPTLRTKPIDRYDFHQGASVSRADIDHCFTGWDGRAAISWQDRPWALEVEASRNLRCAVVYANSIKDEFCFEPVAHLNDAINRSTEFAMPVLAPGERFESRIELRVVPAI